MSPTALTHMDFLVSRMAFVFWGNYAEILQGEASLHLDFITRNYMLCSLFKKIHFIYMSTL